MHLLLYLRQSMIKDLLIPQDSYHVDVIPFVFDRKNEKEIIEIVIKQRIKLCTLWQSSVCFCKGVNSGLWMNLFSFF